MRHESNLPYATAPVPTVADVGPPRDGIPARPPRPGSVYVSSLYSALTAVFLAILSVIVGRRDLAVGQDTDAYVHAYQRLRSCKCMVGWHEPGFESLSLIPAYLGLDQVGYLTFLSGIGMLLVWGVSRSFAEREPSGAARFKLQALIISLFLASPMFLSSQINAMRQGLAALALLAAVVSLENRRLGRVAAWSVAAVSFHYTSVLFLLALVLLWVPSSILYLIAVGSLLSYVIGASPDILAAVSSASGIPIYGMVAEYGREFSSYYRTGVRIDFVVASLVFWLVAYIASRFGPQEVRSRLLFLLRSYVCLSIPFLWLGWGVFSNRYLFTPWLIVSAIGGVAAFGMLRRLSIQMTFGLVLLSGAVFVAQLAAVIQQ